MNRNEKTGVVITMAGASSRFTRAGYDRPKYEVEVHGQTLFSWSMRSLQGFIEAESPFTFVARRVEGVESFIRTECQELGIRVNAIVMVDALTDGQATTALLAGENWDDPARPIAIYNIDTCVNPASLHPGDIRGAGWIPCFAGRGDHWSFAAVDQNGRVTEVREKQRVSPHATIGLYWFDSFARYAAAYKDHYAFSEHSESRERYIAPLYNQLIQDGAEVFIQTVPEQDVFPLGTPEDVEIFRANPAPRFRAAVSAQ